MEIINVAAAHITMPELAANRIFWVSLVPCPCQSESRVSTKENGNGFSLSAI